MHITSETVRDEHARGSATANRSSSPPSTTPANDWAGSSRPTWTRSPPRRTGARSMRCSRTARSRSTSRAASPCFATSTSLATTRICRRRGSRPRVGGDDRWGRPLSLLAQATFHFVDVHVSEDATADGAGAAGADDLDAALAAGSRRGSPGGTGGREKARSRWRHRLTSSAGSAAAEQRSARELPDEVVSGIEDCVGEEPCKHADPGGGAGLDAGRWLRCARGVDDRVGDDFGLDRAGTVTPPSWVSSKIS